MINKLENIVMKTRKKEYLLLNKWYQNDDKPILNVYGPGGVGKTFLVKEFTKNYPCVHIQKVNEVKDLEEGSFYVIDNIDKSNLLKLKKIITTNNIIKYKMILISRIPLDLMMHPYLRNMTLPLEIKDFDYKKTRLLLDKISDKESVSIYQKSRGRPLLIDALIKGIEFKALAQQFFKDNIFGNHRYLLEWTCFLWRFNREILKKIISNLSSTLYNELVSLSYINNDRYGFFLSPPARRILLDLIDKSKTKRYTESLKTIIEKKILEGREPRIFWIMNYLFSQNAYFSEHLSAEYYDEEITKGKKFLEIWLKHNEETKGLLSFKTHFKLKIKEDLSEHCVYLEKIELPQTPILSFQHFLIKNFIELGLNQMIIVPEWVNSCMPFSKMGFFKLSHYYVLDIKNEGVLNWLKRISEKNASESRLYSKEEIISFVRDAFKNWSSEKELVSGEIAELLLREDQKSLPVKSKAELLKRKLKNAVENLKEQEPFLNHFIYTGLINPQLPRRELAKIFNISERTYYRRVKEAVYKVAQVLFEKEEWWRFVK